MIYVARAWYGGHMFKTALFTFLLLAVAPGCIAGKDKPQPQWETGRVVSQQLNQSQTGTRTSQRGTRVYTNAIYSSTNSVVVETEKVRYEWVEYGNRSVILPVEGQVNFYRDGDWFIVLDAKQKKHKFSLTGMTTIVVPMEVTKQ